nr:hypothetical protein [Tanacetum cinerariifolium]
MCLNSWGRSAYSYALIEISADEVLKEDLVIAIPIGKNRGHSLVTINIEYEWRPPMCSTCLIFDHVNDKCPKLPKEVSPVEANNKDAFKHSNGIVVDYQQHSSGLSDYKAILKPSKSILKTPSTPTKEGRKVSMNSSIMVWEVETDYESLIRDDIGSPNIKNVNASATDSMGHAKEQAACPQQDVPFAKKPMTDSNFGDSNTSDTNDLGTNAKHVAGPKVSTSFASVLKPNKNKVVQIMELRNEEYVEGAAVTLPLSAIEEVSSRFVNTLYGYFVGKRLAFRLVENYVHNAWAKFGIKQIQLHGDFFLFQFENKEGMDRVLESGPWLIRMVPLILNVWSPDSDLHKADIKKVPVWVKLHKVPIVTYSEVGLSLITTQIRKPIWLDTYTSNMCLNSWGRSAYSYALIEISADEVLKEDLVIAIPIGKNRGHSLVTINIEYEWRPPMCSTCLIFDHVNDKCPKLPKEVSPVEANNKDAFKHSNGTADDRFEVVKKKRNKKKKHQKQVDRVVLNKPSLQLHYRRVDKNSFSALNKDEDYERQTSQSVINESDSDVDEMIILDDRGGSVKIT